MDGLDLIARQRTRNIILALAVLAVALLNGALLASVATALTGSAAVGLSAAGVVALLIAGGVVSAEGLALGDAEVAGPEHPAQLVVDRLALRYEIQAPSVWIDDDPAPNAWAIAFGKRAKIVFTQSLLALLDGRDEELEAVAGHELAHIANRDSLVAGASLALFYWVSAIYGTFNLIAHFLYAVGPQFAKALTTDSEGRDDRFAILVRPTIWLTMACFGALLQATGLVICLLAELLSLGLCRQREWMADATAARLTGKPEALCSALALLEGAPTRLRQRLVQDLCIAGLPPAGGWWADLLETHPSSQRRIARLEGRPEHSPFRSLLVSGFALRTAFIVVVVGTVLVLGPLTTSTDQRAADACLAAAGSATTPVVVRLRAAWHASELLAGRRSCPRRRCRTHRHSAATARGSRALARTDQEVVLSRLAGMASDAAALALAAPDPALGEAIEALETGRVVLLGQIRDEHPDLTRLRTRRADLAGRLEALAMLLGSPGAESGQ